MTAPELTDRDAPSANRSSAIAASCRCTATGCSAPRGGRGPHAGDVPARVAGARPTRGARRCARGCTGSRPTPAWTRWRSARACRPPTARCRGCSRSRTMLAARGRRRDRRRGRRARDDRAGVPGRDPAPAAAPARGADPARRARLAREGHRRAARDHRGLGQLRAAAGAGGAEGAPARAAQRVGGGRAAPPTARWSRATWRPPRPATRRRCKALLPTTCASRCRPSRACTSGRDTIVGCWVQGGFGDPERLGEFRCVLTRANRPARGRQLPRARPGEDTFARARARRADDRGRRRSPTSSRSRTTAFAAFGLAGRAL